MKTRVPVAVLCSLIVVASAATAQKGAEINDVEVGITNGTVAASGNATLYLGDATDDAVQLQSGTGDNVAFSVDGGTNAMTILGTQSAAGIPGIVTLDHQSRARWYLTIPQPIPPAAWTPILFDSFTFDEHTEGLLVPDPAGGPPLTWTFTPNVAGYYQVNARTEFHPGMAPGVGSPPSAAPPPGPLFGVSIAIFKNGVIHSQGNNLQIFFLLPLPPPEVLLEDNNAPNVSDVVYLTPQDFLEIHAWSGLPSTLDASGPHKTYVSVHKVS